MRGQSQDGAARRRTLLMLVTAILAIPSQRSMGRDWTAVAITGDAAPGFSPGATFLSGFQLPKLDDAGRVTFWGSVLDGSPTAALWATGPNGHGLIPYARDRQTAPNSGSFQYSIGLVIPLIGPQAGVAFQANLLPGDFQTNGGIYGGQPRDVQLIARSNTPAPGIPGASFKYINIGTPVVTNGAQVAFSTLAVDPVTNVQRFGVWSGTPGGSTSLVVFEGMTLPDNANDTFQGSFRLYGMTRNGDVGFNSTGGLWIGQPGDVRRVSFNGHQIPGANDAKLATDGTWVYPDQNVLQSLRPNGEHLNIATLGADAPGTPPGTKFGAFPFPPGDSAILASPSAHAVGFFVTLTGPDVDSTNDNATYLSIDGQLRLVDREGMPAPGTSDLFDHEGRIFANDSGQFVLVAGLTGPDVTTHNDLALWFDYGDGALHLVLREGDPFQVNGTTRIIDRIQLAETFNGYLSETYMNNAGQFVCDLSFTDGSAGVFLFQASEPSGPKALVIAAALMATRRRRTGSSELR